MKKFVLTLFLLSNMFMLTGCTNKTLKCTTSSETFEYTYNDKELISYSYNGEKQTGDVFDTAVAAVEAAGGIVKYIESTKTGLEALGATCE